MLVIYTGTLLARIALSNIVSSPSDLIILILILTYLLYYFTFNILDFTPAYFVVFICTFIGLQISGYLVISFAPLHQLNSPPILSHLIHLSLYLSSSNFSSYLFVYTLSSSLVFYLTLLTIFCACCYQGGNSESRESYS